MGGKTGRWWDPHPHLPDLCLLWVGKVNGLVKCQELGSWGSACLIKPSGHLQTAQSENAAGSGYCFQAVRTWFDNQTRFWPPESQTHARCPFLGFCLSPAFWSSGRAMVDTGAGQQSQCWVQGESNVLFWCWRRHLLLEQVREGPPKGKSWVAFSGWLQVFQAENCFLFFFPKLNLFILKLKDNCFTEFCCQISTWISHRYTYIPSLLNLPPIRKLFLKRHRRIKQPDEVRELWVDDDWRIACCLKACVLTTGVGFGVNLPFSLPLRLSCQSRF